MSSIIIPQEEAETQQPIKKQKTIPTQLATQNAHARDPYIEFDEGPHIYTVHGEGGYTSVTTWNHSHFSHFDADLIVDRIMRSKKMSTDPTYKYYGMTRQDILASWDKNRDAAAGAGTQMHYDIECFWNGVPNENDSIEYGYFKNFVRDFPELRAYRTEWMIYYEELKLSGSIDMVFENPDDGTIQIYDWKRSKEIKYEDEFGGKTANKECIGDMPDTNFWHYALQLNTYKRILELKYGKTVTGLYLVIMHPDNYGKNYDRIEVPFLTEKIDALFALRQKEVEQIKQK
jgi:hypothetical protein